MATLKSIPHLRGSTSDRYGNEAAQDANVKCATRAPDDRSLLAGIGDLSNIIDHDQKQAGELADLIDRLCKDVVGENEDGGNAVDPTRPSYSPLDARLQSLRLLTLQRQVQIDRLRRALGL